MQKKMTRFLTSIGISDLDRFDMDFVLVARDQYNQNKVNMAIEKQSPWEYSLLDEFTTALSTQNYQWEIRFSYTCEITPDDVGALFVEWYFSHYFKAPSFETSSPKDHVFLVTYPNPEENAICGKRVAEFRKFLKFINYDYRVEETLRAEMSEPTPIEEPKPFLQEDPVSSLQEAQAPEFTPLEETSAEVITKETTEEADVQVAEDSAEETAPVSFESDSNDDDDSEPEEGEEPKKQEPSSLEAGEEYLLNLMRVNAEKMKEERNRKRVFTTGDYKPVQSISEIEALPLGNVDFDGEIYEAEAKLSKKGSMYGIFGVGDPTDAISVRAFAGKRLKAEDIEGVKVGARYRIRGALDNDKYSGRRMVIAHFLDILPPKEPRKDNEEEKRVELHLHTNMSTMDAVPEMSAYVKAAYEMGMKALAVTDHGVVQSFPKGQETAASLAKKYGYELKMIYGCEVNMFDLQQNYVMNPSNIPLKGARYCVFDTETTGLSARYDRIIEFGGVIVENGNPVRRMDVFIKPDIDLEQAKEAMAINHITSSDLANARSIHEVLPEILEFLGDNVLVAHNATFDVGFINAALAREGLPPLSNPIIDTIPISHYLFPFAGYHNEGAMLRNLGLNTYNDKDAHRADYDAEHLNEGWQEILLRLEKEHPGITHADLNDLIIARPDPTTIEGVEDPNDPRRVAYDKQSETYNSFCKHIRAYHTIILAKNKQGVKDLYRIVTEGHTTYLAGASNPKTPRSLISKYRENFLIGSGCFNGEIFELANTRNLDVLVEAMKFYDYIEIQPLENYSYLLNMGRIHSKEHLIELLRDIVKAAHLANRPVVATGDCHYLNPEDKILRDVYIYAQAIGKGSHPMNPPARSRRPRFENPDQHFRTTREMLDSFEQWMSPEEAKEYVVTNTNAIADQCTPGIIIVTEEVQAPNENLPNSAEKLRNLCYNTFHEEYDYKFGDNDPEVLAAIDKVKARLDRELEGIIGHGYAVTYFIAHKLIKLANEEPEHYIVGSRGSVGSSFAATMAKITEVNALPAHYHCPNCHWLRFEDAIVFKSGFDLPDIKCPKCGTPIRGNGQNIPFETFLGFAADKVPDIDLNFEEESQHKAHNYTKVLLGEKNVFRAGTIETVAEKTAFGFVRGYFEKTGHNVDAINPAYISYLASKCTGVKRTTGQHPGGIVVVPSNLDVYDFTAVQHPADDFHSEWLTTHFDFHSMHDEILKFDILGHVDPMAMRYYRDLSGVRIEDIPMNDPKVLSLFVSPAALNLHRNYLKSTTGASALPEFGTKLGQQMLDEAHPKTFNDLLIISGLAHGTNVWNGNAEDLILKEGKTLNEVIGCRDDIMTYLISMGLPPQMSFKIMEDVRKGRKLKPDYETEMRAHKVPEYYIESCNKIHYLFPRGHATAYVMMAVRVAYFKLYYPLQFYAVFFSIRSDDWDIKAMIAGEDAIIARIQELEGRLNDRQNPLSPKENNILKTLYIACEMVERGYKFLNIDLYRSDWKMFVVDEEEKALIPPFSVIDGLGQLAAKTICDAREELDDYGRKKRFLSKEDLLRRAKKLNGTNLKDLEELGVLDGLGETNQMSLFEFC